MASAYEIIAELASAAKDVEDKTVRVWVGDTDCIVTGATICIGQDETERLEIEYVNRRQIEQPPCRWCKRDIHRSGGTWYVVHKSSALGLPPDRCGASPSRAHEPGP